MKPDVVGRHEVRKGATEQRADSDRRVGINRKVHSDRWCRFKPECNQPGWHWLAIGAS
jgi:hypothetical protein